METLLELKGITKVFGDNVANDGVNLKIFKGEIHVLLGENGAGKTTLMNCISGLYIPDQGKIFWEGKEIQVKTPQDAAKCGIGMVHQHFMLVDNLTVLENILLSGLRKRFAFLNKKQKKREVLELMRSYGLDVDLDTQIWQLPVGLRQRVEIIKVLYNDAKLIILDEPTAVLTPYETEELFKVLKFLTAQGRSVIFITHKLEEALRIGDRISVMRRGKIVHTFSSTNVDKNLLVRLMMGEEIEEIKGKKSSKVKKDKREIILEVRDLYVKNDQGTIAVKGISLEVGKGEILGIAGVAGNGQSELVEALAGLRLAIKGNVYFKNKDITNAPPRLLRDLGIVHIPEDRHKHGMIGEFSVKENFLIGSYYRYPFSKRMRLQHEYIEKYARMQIKKYNIKVSDIRMKAKYLSGGNQQKLILARELSKFPELIIAAYPTRGLDIFATKFVHEKLLEYRDKGASIIFVSSELDELMEVSDRIIVLFKGEIAGSLSAKETDKKTLGFLMAGETLLFSERK
ncbi:MAG: ABC transporter ATP-binding protein [Thermoanaerobacter sp.]|nr:ABC transporter ATP-binding protein [Thermoanaerobacter sp.]